MANIFNVDRVNNIIVMGTTGTTTRFPFLTATRMTYLNGECDITSISDLTAWVGGTANQITATDDGDGTLTLSTPQDINTGASPQFTGIELGHATDTTITRVSAGVIAVEGTNVMLVGDAPTAHTIASHSDTTGTGAELNTLTGGGDVGALHTHAAAYQPLDAGLTSLAGLTYAAASFVKMTGANTFALRTIGETADDLQGTIDHNLTANYDANKHIDHTGVTLTAGTGLTGGGDISSNRTFAVDGLLEDLDTLGANSADSEFLVGTGAGALAWESGATARTSIGLGTGDSPTFNGLILSEDIVFSADYKGIRTSTSDGSDNQALWIAGGGEVGNSRGSYSIFYGNEHATYPGELHLYGGNIVGAGISCFVEGYEKLQIKKLKVTVNTTFQLSDTLYINEQNTADADVAGYGQLWVKTATPNVLMFTDDAGTDFTVDVTPV